MLRQIVSRTTRLPGMRGFATQVADPVILDYNELRDSSSTTKLSDLIQEAYGPDGLGILAVKNVPDVATKRQALLPLAHKLSHLPQEQLAELEDPESLYSVGWSYGREKFLGRFDTSKGSFYGNPLFDHVTDDEEILKKYPGMVAPNIWPRESMPELEPAFKDMGRLMVHVGELVAGHCDQLVRRELPSFPENKMRDIVRNSRVPKGRFLYYFAQTQEQIDNASEEDKASWCGWHNDHGSLTGLCPAMYMNAETGEEVPCPDEEAGLFAKSRDGQIHRVLVPSDHLAFQIGETSQILSAGVLQATPHAVRAAAVPGVARSTLAIFMEPEWDEPMCVPEGANRELVLKGARGGSVPEGVPLLDGRWTGEDQSFGDFTEKTLSEFY